MNSKKTTHRTSSHPSTISKRAPYKFLTRNLRVSDINSLAFQKVCIKRVYLKKLIDQRSEGFEPEEIVYRSFKHNKLLKTLKYLQVPSLSQSYVHESLKSSKNLKAFSINSYNDDTELRIIAFYLKKLPLKIHTIRLRVIKDSKEHQRNFYKVAKSIRLLKKLEYFQRCYMLESNDQHIPKELKAYSDSASRLKKLDKIVYTLFESEQVDFKKVMRRGIIHPGITALKMNLSGEDHASFRVFEPQNAPPEESFDVDLPSAFDNLTPLEQRVSQIVAYHILQIDQSQNEDLKNPINPQNNHNEEVDSEDDSIESVSEVDGLRMARVMGANFILSSLFREEIKPFYRFELFPNLKKLSISQADHFYALDSFVIDGFAALKKLEHLKLDIQSRSVGSHFLFKGFLKLPLLKKFSLHINFIKNNDWLLLQQFVKDQKNLESFSLMISNQPGNKSRYLQQNAYLEGLIQCFEDKPLLKSLEFRSSYWSLEAISKGLGHLSKMVNQLKTFKFEGSDDTITSDQKPWKRVEGLCNFIKNQKESLEKLWVFLPFVLEDNPVTHIAEAISKLTQLKELHFSVNSCFIRGLGHFVQYFENTLQSPLAEKSKKSLKVSNTWSPTLGKYFKRLENLEEFILRFDIIVHKNSPNWFVDVMTALPNLEKLRHVRVTTNSGRLLYKGEDKVIAAVLQLKNVRRFNFVSFDNMSGFFPSLIRLKQMAAQFTEKQSMRCDLMF